MSLADQFADWRNRLISNPKFQAWAVRNPLTRGVARQRSKATFDLVAGFAYSQILLAAVESGMLQAAGEGPLDEAQFAALSTLPPEGARRLLRAAAALDLVRLRHDGRYSLGETGAGLIGNPAVFAMIRHHKAFYLDITDPLALLRERRTDTGLAEFWAYQSSAGAQEAGAYSALMAETQVLVAQDILDAYDFRRHRTVMDVGGGLGGFLEAVGTAHPGPELVLVDLPPVARLAEARLSQSPLAARFRIEPRDMLRDPLPTGADLISFVRVIHDHDDAPVLDLLTAARRALAPGGRVLIAEPMAGIGGVEAMGDAYFGLYLWAMGRGAPRRPKELTALLKRAGFAGVRRLRTAQPLLVSALLAS